MFLLVEEPCISSSLCLNQIPLFYFNGWDWLPGPRLLFFLSTIESITPKDPSYELKSRRINGCLEMKDMNYHHAPAPTL